MGSFSYQLDICFPILTDGHSISETLVTVIQMKVTSVSLLSVPDFSTPLNRVSKYILWRQIS